MDGYHPKRRKDKYNPYTICEKDGLFYLSFRDGQNIRHELLIDRELYALLDSFELEDLSYLNEWDRHLEQSELSEATLEQRMVAEPFSVEDAVYEAIRNEQLRMAVDRLPAVQRRRLLLHFCHDLTYEEIGRIEGCSAHSVYVAIERAKEKIKKFLKQV